MKKRTTKEKILTTGGKLKQTIIIKKDEVEPGVYIDFDDMELPVVGKKYLVCSSEDVEKSYETEKLFWDDSNIAINEGMGGNMDNSVKCYHGWRGTTSGTSVYAHGVRVCEIVERKEYITSVHYIVQFGKDLVKELD